MVGHTPSVDSRILRNAMGNFCTGVTVITAVDGDTPLGFTCQSVTSVSLNPSLVSFCPAKTSTTWPLLKKSRRLCINILSHDQQDLCLGFARSGENKFDNVEWESAGNLAPRLSGALAHIEATIVAEHDAGDHVIVLASVTDVGVDDSKGPLLFYRGGFDLSRPMSGTTSRM
ncbi:flavin reductase family protein [Gordonia sp. LSe1-13]|uniref:Flavin reductase family protein n=1 Tax=Gordonia sesuvii TaxID=3116777 RepID=A0ABU7M999_9ACTN|nr:flavin reductase family protein [Gordonia sp. LSe1-13]